MTCCGIVLLKKSSNVISTKSLQVLTIEEGRVGGNTNGFPMSVFNNSGVFLAYVTNGYEYATAWNNGNPTMPNIFFNGIGFTTNISSPIVSLKGDYIIIDEETMQPILDENNKYIFNENPYP